MISFNPVPTNRPAVCVYMYILEKMGVGLQYVVDYPNCHFRNLKQYFIAVRAGFFCFNIYNLILMKSN